MGSETGKNLTTLEYVVLGMIGVEPQSGYSLITTFESGIFRWSASPGSIYPTLKRLEQAGFVARRRNPQDEREVKVTLSTSGKEVFARTGCLRAELLKRSGMTANELIAFNRQIQKLRDAVAGTSGA